MAAAKGSEKSEPQHNPDRPKSPISSCLSLRSEKSMRFPLTFTKEDADKNKIGVALNAAAEREKPEPDPDGPQSPTSSCVSMRSEKSMNVCDNFTKKDAEKDPQEIDSSESKEMDGNAIFELVEEHAKNFLQSELQRYKKMLFPHLSQSCEDAEQMTSSEKSATEGSLKIILYVLKKIKQEELAITLEKQIYGDLGLCQRRLRQKLKKSEYIYEGTAQGKKTPFNKVYTELYITEGVGGSINNEHEIRQIEAATRRRAIEDKPIKYEDIFKPLLGHDQFIRVVLTKGISGIGKTFTVQKFNLEWAEGRVDQEIQLLVNLPFRELNLMKRDRPCTLTKLLHHFLKEAKETGISNFDEYKLLLIFDGLDECHLPLDFDHNKSCSSISEAASVDVLLTNLIKGNLLPLARIWMTSRPAAANRIPSDLIDRVTEIRGFNNPQKEEYFRRKISDQIMADKVISHVKSTRSLYIMCHIPVFSWISATVLQKLEEDGCKGEMPKTLTQMYTHFLLYNSIIRTQKYPSGEETKAKSQDQMDEDMILKLGKLAFEHLMKGNMIFYENDLNEYNISIVDAAVYSGIFTQISQNDSDVHLVKVYCFVHLSIQEFFAAMYIYHSYTCFSKNLLEQQGPTTVQEAPGEVTSLLKSAVDKALQSKTGHLDLFLRFLLGLSQISNQILLNSVLTTIGRSSPRNEEIVEYIKKKINENPPPERCINLFHCLRELNDQSLLEEIQNFLSSDSLSETKLSPSQWSALVFVLLTSEEESDEFDLRKFSRSEDGLLRLLPVIKESRVVLLKECNLTETCCEAIGAVLSNSCLKELDLSNNDLHDSGVKLLCAGLASPACHLEKLRLPFCGITEIGCGFLAKALRSNPTHLKELDLSYNHPGQQGMEILSCLQKDIKHLSVRLNGNAECYLKSALRKYACELTMDLKTAHSHLSFSDDNKKMTRMKTAQPYNDGPDRFSDWGQVLCEEGLSSRCYWEAEWTGEWTGIGVAYKGISRKAEGNESVLGYNNQSWSLRYRNGKYTAWYNKDNEDISVPYFKSKRVGVFLDWSAGTLSFYVLSPYTMTHLHTFHAKFSEPLYPGFRLGEKDSSLTLCQPEYNERVCITRI